MDDYHTLHHKIGKKNTYTLVILPILSAPLFEAKVKSRRLSFEVKADG
jgi:hypothetical protein